jgi:protease-4
VKGCQHNRWRFHAPLFTSERKQNVKAIVLRIRQSRWQRLTSDLSEVELTKKWSPWLSVGNYALGGYYIACNIKFLENNTITVHRRFGILPNFSKLTSKNRHQRRAGKYSWELTLIHLFLWAINSKQSHLKRSGIFYNTLPMSPKDEKNWQVDSIAQGRVWSGSEAIKWTCR